MRTAFKLKVEDVLKRNLFQEAELVAGRKGLDRIIRWVHIIEVTEIGQLLNGNEIILSTGVGWKEEGESLSFLRQLINEHVSALCVELGTYIKKIPDRMTALADQHDFPIIVFHKAVRFIDITQDLNSLLIETRDRMMSDLEGFSNRLNHLLLSTDGFKSILRLLHDYTGLQVMYLPVEGKSYFFPDQEESSRLQLLSRFHSNTNHSSHKVKSHPIQALGHRFADLVIFPQTEDGSEFDDLLLDRTATALAQDQLRVLYVEEKRKYQENRWVQKWLNGDRRPEEIEQYLSALSPSLEPKGCTVCLCRVDFSREEPDFTYYSMVFRSIFEQQGFFLLPIYEWNQIVFVLINKRKMEDWKIRLNQALAQIHKTDLVKAPLAEPLNFSVGKLFAKLQRLHESYEMAQETLYIQEKTGKSGALFYEELYVYELIFRLNKGGGLTDFVNNCLGPVLKYDERHKGQMFATLKVFLEVQGSKREAAKRLFIVRQTLYHRIEKLKELLGDDFMKPEKRLAIEFSIYTLEFMQPRSDSS